MDPMLRITSKKLAEVTWNQASSFLKGGTPGRIYREQHSRSFWVKRTPQARLKHTYWDNRKDPLPEQQAEGEVQNWRESHLPRNIETAMLDWMPQSRSQTYSSQDTKVFKYLFFSLSCSTTFILTDLTFPLGWGTHPQYYLDQCNHKRSFTASNSSVKHTWQHDKNPHRDTLKFSCSIWPT